MSHKYMNAVSQPSSLSQSILNSFDNLVEEQFENAPDIFTISEESSFGSGILQNVIVRINRGINMYTGQKLGDDYKLIIFKEKDHDVNIGSKFYFDNNYWLVNNVESIKNFACSAMVKRCNNVLRWCDENGVIYEEPCSIDYSLKRPVDSEVSINPMTPEGFIELFAQLNDKTQTIDPNQRFLFGNPNEWVCYRVFGGGIKHFVNNETESNDTSRLMFLSLGTNYINEQTDDLVNGIADYYKNIYELLVYPEYISGSIGDTFQIVPTLTVNGLTSIKELEYSSSAGSIASVSGSGGLVNLLSSGEAIITVEMSDNSLVTGSVLVQVSGSVLASYDIRIIPLDRYIYEGETTTFTAYAYSNGSPLADVFTFTVANDDVPQENYTLLSISGNSFSVKNNELYLDNPLEVSIASGSGSISIDLELRGAW